MLKFPVQITAVSRKPHAVLAEVYSASCPCCHRNMMIFSEELGAQCPVCGNSYEVDFDREIITNIA